jgi:hypothetical protein
VARSLQVMLEMGPKGKRVVATAPEWPGLERGAKTEEAAIERVLAYCPRYAAVAELAGMGSSFPAEGAAAEVVERYPGVGSTDFWGISFAFSASDHQPLSVAELERELALMRGCWSFLDQVSARVPAELLKGPRGGGRDRDQIVRHTVGTEREWAKKLGLRYPEGGSLTNAELAAHRDAYRDAIRAKHAQRELARSWPLRFLIRHTAFHTMDHAWEMEDRDLSAG